MVKKLKPNQLNISSNQNMNGLRACVSTGRNDSGPHPDPGQWTAVLEETRMCLLSRKRIRNCYFEKLFKKITVAVYRKSEEDRSC